MARMLESISLLLIGGAIGALAATGVHRSSETIGQPVNTAASPMVAGLAEEASADTGSIARAQITQIVRLGTRPTTPPEALPASRPAMRPILIGTGETGSTGANDRRETETRLAEAIQTELKRVGCYTGSVNGTWGNETRRAMRAFNDRVNASLPIDRPDYILLTLLQGHAAKACGAACPTGQELSDRNKCLPRSVIAEERRRLVAERRRVVAEPQAATSPQVATSPQATTSPQAASPTTTRAAVALSSGSGGDSPVKAPATTRADASAALERQRIAAAEARREREAAEITARQEAERRAQAAAAEKARTAAETHRREEIAALAARAAARAAAAATPSRAETRPSTAASIAASPPTPPPLPLRPSPDFRQQVVAARANAEAETGTAAAAPHDATHHRRSRGARYAGQFPPPPYRVGRLPAFRAGGIRVYAYAPRPTSRRGRSPQGIFRQLQYLMP